MAGTWNLPPIHFKIKIGVEFKIKIKIKRHGYLDIYFADPTDANSDCAFGDQG